MPFNGSGQYNAPSSTWNPAVAATQINPADWNALLIDLSTALSTTITKDGQTTPTADLPMGGYRHTNVNTASARNQYAAASQVQDSSLTWGGTAGGTADALTLTLSPAITAYGTGQSFLFIAGASPNTGAATININSVGAVAIQNNGAALAAGAIAAGVLYRITYTGTAFQLSSTAIVAAASETVAGIIEIATAAETTTGTDDTRAITPLKLTTWAPATATPDTAADKVLFLDATDSKIKQGIFPASSNYYGTGADGALSTSGNVNLATSTGVNDTGVVIKNYTSITINVGDTVTAANRAKAMLLYCTGNVTINGTLTMTAKGAAASISSDVSIARAITNALFPNETALSTFLSVQVGGAAGAANSGTGGTITNGTGGGGGGAGNVFGLSAGGAGAAGTAICGGSGGGAGNNVGGSAGAANGGQGGNAATASGDRGIGGGAGNPVGTGSAAGTASVTAPSGGGGGLLIIVAAGTVTIGASGTISANGGTGGNANGGGAVGSVAMGGGGGGGGRIIILSASTYTNSGTVQANGGAGGTATNATNTSAGGAGGAGAITQQLIAA